MRLCLDLGFAERTEFESLAFQESNIQIQLKEEDCKYIQPLEMNPGSFTQIHFLLNMLVMNRYEDLKPPTSPSPRPRKL